MADPKIADPSREFTILATALKGAQAQLAAASDAVGHAWFAGDVSLAEAITRKCSALERLGARFPDDGERS